MDDQRFDRLTVALASRTSRRGLLKAGGAVMAGAVGGASISSVDARPAPEMVTICVWEGTRRGFRPLSVAKQLLKNRLVMLFAKPSSQTNPRMCGDDCTDCQALYARKGYGLDPEQVICNRGRCDYTCPPNFIACGGCTWAPLPDELERVSVECIDDELVITCKPDFHHCSGGNNYTCRECCADECEPIANGTIECLPVASFGGNWTCQVESCDPGFEEKNGFCAPACLEGEMSCASGSCGECCVDADCPVAPDNASLLGCEHMSGKNTCRYSCDDPYTNCADPSTFFVAATESCCLQDACASAADCPDTWLCCQVEGGDTTTCRSECCTAADCPAIPHGSVACNTDENGWGCHLASCDPGYAPDADNQCVPAGCSDANPCSDDLVCCTSNGDALAECRTCCSGSDCPGVDNATPTCTEESGTWICGITCNDGYSHCDTGCCANECGDGLPLCTQGATCIEGRCLMV